MLNFQQLRTTNTFRCIEEFKHPLALWSVSEWGAATAGECGEACNIAKKLLRIRDGMEKLNRGVSENTLRFNLAEEIADTVLYADLWAASQDIDLARAIIAKFNADSRKHGVSMTLAWE